MTLTAINAHALEYENDNGWLKEKPGAQYFYTSFHPNDDNINAMMETLMSGEWELEISGVSNSTAVFQGRLRSKVSKPKSPELPYSRDWAKWMNSSLTQAFTITGDVTELEKLFKEMGRKGYTPIYIGVNTPLGEYRYAFFRQ